MGHSVEELGNMKVADLRALAKSLEHEAVSGYSAMRKDELVAALATALADSSEAGTDGAEGASSAAPPVAARRPRGGAGQKAPQGRRRLTSRRIPTEGLDKSAIKQRIRALKDERSEALQARDMERLRVIRRQIHQLKRRTRALAS